LAGRGPDRLARGRAQLGLLSAHADGEVRRALTTALEVAHESLHRAVLERVEADHGKATAGTEHRERCGQRGLERAQLVVHRNAQRLEDTLRGMAVAEAGRRGNRGLDRLDEVAGP